jgi:hypothetical protein
MANNSSWNDEDSWWRDNFSSRPYGTGRNYEEFRPAYQYGHQSAQHHMGRAWNDVESDLKTGWNKAEGRGSSTWESVKDAVKDAWERVTGHHDVDTDKMSETGDRFSQGRSTR